MEERARGEVQSEDVEQASVMNRRHAYLCWQRDDDCGLNRDKRRTKWHLYDREKQLVQLRGALQRRRDAKRGEGSREIVIISGVSGTGKTVLAQSLQHEGRDENPEGSNKCGCYYFLLGKFNQLRQQHPQAFDPFVVAFTQFTELVVARGDGEIDRMRDSIKAEISDSEQAILIKAIPALVRILPAYSQKRGPTFKASLKGKNAHRRFLYVFVRFLRAVCSTMVEDPLVLCLDDLQWADSSSLDLVHAIASDKPIARMGGLLLVSTCRGNEVSFKDPLSVTLRDLENSGVLVSEIRVSNLGPSPLADMISEFLEMSIDDSTALAQWVYRKTDGNIFFALQLLQTLHEERLLFIDENNKWRWNGRCDVIDGVSTDDVVELLSSRMARLSEEVQEVLKVASCVGLEFDEKLLAHLTTTVDPSQILPSLRIAEESGFVTINYELGTAQWVHDRVQQAASLLIPANETEAFHLQIGRLLRGAIRGKSDSDMGDNIYLVVDQLLCGIGLIDDTDEKDELVELCLQAAKKALASSAFVVAATYLEAGLDLLPLRPWRDQYELCLELHNRTAEIAYYDGNFARVDALLNEIFVHARSFEDTVWAHRTRISSMGARNQAESAIPEGLNLMAKLGENFPKRGTMARILLELTKTRRLLHGITDDDILALPLASDNQTKACMQIIGVIGVYAFWIRPDLFPIITMRAVRLSLRYGLTGLAIPSFAAYAAVLVNIGKVDDGHRYALLSLRLLEKFQESEWLPRTFAAVYSMVMPIREPFRKSLTPLLTAHGTGLVSGDIEFSMLCAALYCQLAVNAGSPLARLVEEMQSFMEQFDEHGQGPMSRFQSPLLQCCLNLTGDTPSADPLVLSGSCMNEIDMIKDSDTSTLAWILVLKAFLAVHWGDFDVSASILRRLQRVETRNLTSFGLACNIFHEALTWAVLGRKSKRNLRRARRHLKKLTSYLIHSPDNFANKIHLVEAEMAMSCTHYDVAFLKFHRSADCARQAGLTHEEAMAHERLGFALFLRRNVSEASKQFERARSLYNQWGASVKVEQLDNRIASLNSC